MAVSRRGLIRGGLATVAGVALGVTAAEVPRWLRPDRLPIDGGYAPAGNASRWSPRGGVRTIWHVPTTKPWVALTFDDGPEPDWTPRVLDTLDRLQATATFFLVGERLLRNAALIQGRYDRHEVGNHTFTHSDLAQRDEAAVRDQLRRCHDAIVAVLGRRPTLMRPPWGHLAGTTLTVADEFDYDVVMWSYAMPEQRYLTHPAGIVDDVAAVARPGSILLAHDVGNSSRLVTIDSLSGIITALRAKGLELVTVSQLLSAETAHS
jgi:peptidoglycan/xylan/chitin deacetylase (PgdA/CDA1 family)